MARTSPIARQPSGERELARTAEMLRDMLQSKREETGALFGVITRIASTLDPDRLLRDIVLLCAELTGCHGVVVYLWDEERERLVLRGAIDGYEEWIGRFSLALGEGLTGWTALTRQPGIITDNPQEDPRFKFVPELNDERFQSYLTIPIVFPSERLLGVITMHTEAPHEFTEDDLILMNTISKVLAAALENAQLYQKIERQLQVLHSLAEASHTVVQTSSLQHILFRLATTAGSLIGADACAVLALDESGSHLGLESFWTRGPETAGSPPAAVPADGPWGRLLGATEPFVLARRDKPEAFAAFDSLAPHARTVLVAPVRVAEHVIGTFMCFTDATRYFGSEDQGLMSMIASQAALAVQNARLIEALTERNVVRDLFESLMLGEDSDLGLEARAHRLGADLTRPHVVVSFEVTADPPDFEGDRLWIALRNELAGSFPGSLFSHRDHTMTGMIRLSDSTSSIPLDRLADRLSHGKAPLERPPELLISAGLSRICRSAKNYPEAFEQARQALLMGRATRGRPGVVVTFDELGAQWHLFNVAQQQVRDVYQERLEKLLQHDRDKGSQLFRTVEVYLECMGNAKLAAEKLYVHRNTLRQRFDRIRQVSEVDLGDSERWFDLMMALRIIRLRELSR